VSTWTEIVPGLWRHGYTTKARIPANSFALRLKDGDLAVISPCASPDDAFFADTEKLGKVTALLAPNTGHDLGQRPWQEHYPNAATLAPAVAVAALSKKMRPFEPLSKLSDRLPAGVEVIDLPGVSAGFSLITVDAGATRAVLVDEALNNAQALFGPAPFRLILKLTKSAPGVARNKFWWMLFAKDKRGIANALLTKIEEKKPTVLLPLHGEPIMGPDIERAKACLKEVTG
jgi:hypothetical protein